MKFPTYKEMGEKVAEQALDEYLINGKTLREWIKLLSEQEPTCETCEYESAAFMPCNACKDKSEYMRKKEPCDDAISRADVVDLIEQAVGDKNITIGDFTFGKSLMLHHINELPPVKPKSRVKNELKVELNELEPCEDCDYSEIMDWEQDEKTGKAKPIYWCERHKKPCDDAISRRR